MNTRWKKVIIVGTNIGGCETSTFKLIFHNIGSGGWTRYTISCNHVSHKVVIDTLLWSFSLYSYEMWHLIVICLNILFSVKNTITHLSIGSCKWSTVIRIPTVIFSITQHAQRYVKYKMHETFVVFNHHRKILDVG